jgi:hypothetical protein
MQTKPLKYFYIKQVLLIYNTTVKQLFVIKSGPNANGIMKKDLV